MSRIAEGEAKPEWVWCPRCNRKTDRIQEFKALVVVFLVGWIIYNTETLYGCPRCMRRALLGRALWSIPLANLFCWLVIPFHLMDVVVSFARDRPGIPRKYYYLTEPELRKPGTEDWRGRAGGRVLRGLVVVCILAAAVAFVFLVLPRLTAE